MGDALGTYFQAREWYKTSSLSLENGGSTLSSLALCKLCYETLLKCGKEAKISCDNHLVTPELEAIIEAKTYSSGVGADNGESIYNFSGDVSVKELEDAILLVDAINKEYLKESVR